MTNGKFGRIQEVSLQEAWLDEAKDFTPWLAENLDELGDALDTPLQLQERESPVGTKKLDIFATDPAGNPVVIENQLYPTDDNHLGRLLIYAAGKDAKLVVWIAREIEGEHQMALNWLNQRTDRNTRFYGVTVEVLRIDDSKLAPRFSVVVSPEIIISDPPTDREQQNISFRKLFVDALKQEGCNSRTKCDTKGAWCVLGDKAQDFRYFVNWRANSLNFSITRKGSRGWHPRLSQELEARRSDIEPEIYDQSQGEQVEWDVVEVDGKIVVSRPVNIYGHQESWDEYRDWIVGKFVKFRAVLAAAAGE